MDANELIEKNGLLYKRSHVSEVSKLEEQGVSGSSSASVGDAEYMRRSGMFQTNE